MFWGEVGVIVLGVLIALGAQQLVEAWTVRQDTYSAKRALRQDFETLVVNARERIAEDRCIRARLDYLARVLDEAPGPLPAVGEIGSPPGRGWYPASWDSVVGTRVATALPRDDLVELGSLAQFARQADEENARELETWAQLYRLVGPSRTVPAAEVADLRAAIARAAYSLNLMRLVAPQIEQVVEERRLLTDENRQNIARELARVLAGPNHRTLCGPIGPVPTQRITAPYDPNVQTDPLHGTGQRRSTGRGDPADGAATR